MKSHFVSIKRHSTRADRAVPEIEQLPRPVYARNESVLSDTQTIWHQHDWVQVSYAIGVAEPTSISVETFGTGKVSEELLTQLVREQFDLRPYGLIEMLDLVRPIYKATAAYGHFGREEFPWEKTDKAELLRDLAGLK